MTPAELLNALEQVLRQRRLPFSRTAAIAFVESCWDLIEDNPHAWFWSDRFAECQGGVSDADRRPLYYAVGQAISSGSALAACRAHL
jgi:hypothetical protein